MTTQADVKTLLATTDPHAELAQRCERATGPDRELDVLIGELIETWPSKLWTASLDAAMTLVPEGFILSHLTQQTAYEVGEALRTSVDPHEWRKWRAIVHPQTSDKSWRIGARHLHGGHSDFPALATCAAALRARVAKPPAQPSISTLQAKADAFDRIAKRLQQGVSESAASMCFDIVYETLCDHGE